MRMDRGDGRRVALGACLLVVCVLCSLLLGNAQMPTARLASALLHPRADAAAARILWQLRLPRTLAALVCGAGLAVSGLLLQSAMDNVLAAPSVLGINAGAGCMGLVAAILLPWSALFRQGFTFLGGLLAAALVAGIARGAGAARTTVILAGVAVSSLFNALISWIITVRPSAVADKTAFQLGGLQSVTWSGLGLSAPVVLAGFFAAGALARALELLPLGDETAGGLGLDARRVRLAALVLSAVMASAVVGLCGLISFVGLIVPNLLRLSARGGRGMRGTVLLCAVWGAAFLLLCDLIARRLFYPYELPVGLLLSLLGTPFFILMLLRRRRRLSA